jgi:HEAT repeat protein
MTRHPESSVRIRALRVLAASGSDEATEAIVAACDDPAEGVARTALVALGQLPRPKAALTASKFLGESPSFARRVLAAEALGRLGEAGMGTAVVAPLMTATQRDSYALVREAALRALSRFQAPGLKALAQDLATRDPERKVRELARELAEK